MRVEGIGFGVTLVRRDAITNMIDQGLATIEENAMTFAAEQMEKKFDVKHMIRAFDHVKVETGKLSEDYSFCWRHRQAGGEIWASVDYPITHVGQYGYTGCYGDLLYPKSMKTFPVAEMELA